MGSRAERRQEKERVGRRPQEVTGKRWCVCGGTMGVGGEDERERKEEELVDIDERK